MVQSKYDRAGPLFQDRFLSEAVEDDRYLLTVFRSIHQNPVKIGQDIAAWTSYSDYMGTPKIADVDFILALFHGDRSALDQYLKEVTEEKCLDLGPETKVTDDMAKEIIMAAGNIPRCEALREVDKDLLREILVTLKGKGLSVRQIERLTGINRGIVQKASASRELSP